MPGQGQGNENGAQRGDTRGQQELEYMEWIEERRQRGQRWRRQDRNQEPTAEQLEGLASHRAEAIQLHAEVFEPSPKERKRFTRDLRSDRQPRTVISGNRRRDTWRRWRRRSARIKITRRRVRKSGGSDRSPSRPRYRFTTS